MTKTYTAYSKGDEKMFLYTDDTFTLALSDCADPDLADETTETTPKLLAEIFTAEALRGLLADAGNDADAQEKLNRAIASSAPHSKDSDCTIDPNTDCCTVCGADHSEPCPECGNRAFHSATCGLADNGYTHSARVERR